MHAKNSYLRGWLPWLGLCLLAAHTQAASLQRAEITRLLNEVLVLKPGEKPQQAKVAEVITGETAVRTGSKSRAELEFSDKTLTRLGANSLFSFTQGTRDMSLEEGTMLLQVPKDAGGAKIRTAAVTAAITGTTVMVEHSKGNHSKLIVIEGTMRVYLPNKVGESILLKPGDMLILPPNATRLPNPVRVDLKKLVRTSRLMNTKDFEEIPSEELIKKEVATQQQELKDGTLVNTNIVLLGRGTEVVIATEDMLEAIENSANAQDLIVETPTNPRPRPDPTPRPEPPASKYQPITTIPGTPYVINSTTEVITDPTITTNGKTDQGTLFNASKQGKPSTFFFGETTNFDRKTGFNEDLKEAGDVGVFEFQNLEFRGSPRFITTNGPTTVAFVSRGDMTSSGNGFTLDFSQLDEMYLMTRNGSILIGDGIKEILGPNFMLEFYARGTNSKIVLNAPVTIGNGVVRFYAENSIHLNSTVKAAGIDILTGNSLHLTGILKAPQIQITAAQNVTLNASNIDIPTLEQLFVRSRSLNLNGNFSLSSSQIVLGGNRNDGGSTVGAEAIKGALFEVGAGGVIGGSSLTLHGSINISSVGPIDFSAPGTVIHVDGIIESQASIKFWGDSVVGSATAKNFIQISGEGFAEMGVSLVSNNGAIITKTLDNASDGYAYISSPSLIEYTHLNGAHGFKLDAPKILVHNNTFSSELPSFGASSDILEIDGKLTFDSNFTEPNLTVRVRPGFDVENSSIAGSVDVSQLITNGGGNVALDMNLYANRVLVDGDLKMGINPITTSVLRVGKDFKFETAYVYDALTIEGRIFDNDPTPGTKTLHLGSGASSGAVVAGGIDLQPSVTAVHRDGGSLDIIADDGVNIGLAGIGGAGISSPRINLRGSDGTGASNSGGNFNVVVDASATKPLRVASVQISTETGLSGASDGRSGDINLVHNATSDPGPGRIQISNSKLVTNTAGSREITSYIGSVGNIKLQSLAQSGKGIRISNSSQLLALTNGTMPGGNVDMITDGAAIQISDSFVGGNDVTIDTANSGIDGIVDINNATISAQNVLKIRAYGNGGQLTISSNSVLSAGNQMKLYGGFTNGRVLFTGGGNISLNTPTANIAANIVEVSNGTNVNASGTVNVYANGAGNHKYNDGGVHGNINPSGSVNKFNSTTGAPGF